MPSAFDRRATQRGGMPRRPRRHRNCETQDLAREGSQLSAVSYQLSAPAAGEDSRVCKEQRLSGSKRTARCDAYPHLRPQPRLPGTSQTAMR
jgi:hypothetical protein